MEKAASAIPHECRRNSRLGHLCALPLVVLVCAPFARAQAAQEIQQILERLDRLERQNTELRAEVQDLRKQLASAAGPSAPSPEAIEKETVEKLADNLAVQSARIEEQAQSKVESLQRFPIRITGMALFNAYTNSRSEGAYSSTVATSLTSGRAAGGTLSQSILGLEFFGPGTYFGGKIRGDIQMDFSPYSAGYTITPAYAAEGLAPHLRTGSITMEWGSRSITVGREKPLIAPRDPDSLAQVGTPPLSGAGNLWEWQPQIRVEQNFKLPAGDTITAQASIYATRETNTQVASYYAPTLEPTRPGWEGRVQFAHRRGDDPYLEFAPGFHYSVSHVVGESIASRIVSLDGLFRPIQWIELKGAFFSGQNTAGLGGLGPGFRVTSDADAYEVHSRGGWLQLALFPTQRFSLHFFGGTQINRRADLTGYYPQSNISYAGNAYYRLAPNVYLAFEAAQVRTDWIGGTTHLRNHYDLALAYMF